MYEEDEHQQEGVSVHSGFPNPAADQSLHTLDFNKLLIQHTASTYMFRVRGNAWEDLGVFDGDIAVIDRSLDPHQSDTILWWDNARGEFAISKYTVMPKTAACWGVVTATIHQFRKNGLGKANGKK